MFRAVDARSRFSGISVSVTGIPSVGHGTGIVQDTGNAGEDIRGSGRTIRHPALFLMGSLDQKRHGQNVFEVGVGQISPVPAGLKTDSVVRCDDDQASVVEIVSLQLPEQAAQEPVGEACLQQVALVRQGHQSFIPGPDVPLGEQVPCLRRADSAFLKGDRPRAGGESEYG